MENTVTDVGPRALYALARESWGGATVCQRDGTLVADGIDAYAVSLTDGRTMTVPEDSTYAQFVSAYDQARAAFRDCPYIGIFHDDVKRVIEFDGVAVLASRAEVDALHAAGHPVAGGAYHFATGEGYWPAGRPAEYASV